MSCVAEKVEALDGYEVGQVVMSSWGYDQTNIDFLLITGRKGDWVTLMPIPAIKTPDPHNQMVGTAVPDLVNPMKVGEPCVGYPGSNFNGKPLRRRLRRNEKGEAIGFVVEYGWASSFRGRESARWTAYA